ncbi:hypothetical protein P7C73_g2510, partial [Tremellales sp. Uapishka_1]
MPYLIWSLHSLDKIFATLHRGATMGQTILLQWSWTSPTSQRLSLSDIVLQRVLEHYVLTQPVRSTIQFRTYRANFPYPSSSSSSTMPAPSQSRLLTTIAYSPSASSTKDPSPAPAAATPRDDVIYLFLDDKGAPPSSTLLPPPSIVSDEESQIEIDGFEMINPAQMAPTPQSQSNSTVDMKSVDLPDERKRKRYRTLAVRQAGNVVPLLQNVLSGFVLGLSKSARATASTTAQLPVPTPLPGTPYALTTLTFPPLASPLPPISLSVHNLPIAAAGSILLSASSDYDVDENVLRDFLSGCIPDGVDGERKWFLFEGDDERWEGLEKFRRESELLGRCLRESSLI